MKKTNHHRALVALSLVPELGLRRAKTLLQRTGTGNADDLFRIKLPDLLRVDGIGKQVATNLTRFDGWDEVDKIMKRTEKTGAGLLAFDDDLYPDLLRHIYDPPLVLWVKGDPETLKKPGIAVIGTRQPGSYGLKQTSFWVKQLVEKGFCINSGLAYGVDARAHQAAVETGGKTVAVLGSGIDVIYPSKNGKIAAAILKTGGAILSEYPPGTPPDAVNFPGRNRIVSGMSHGVLVIESGVKGGSMITARYALDQNREVFVVPHPLGTIRGEGCNYLIRTGQGKLVQTPSDIFEEISVETEEKIISEEAAKNWTTMDLDEEAVEICTLLQEKQYHIDQISEIMQKPTYRLLPLMLELEMKGAVRQKAGKYFELC